MQVLLATVGLLFIWVPSLYAVPQVKLLPSNVAYFSNGGSLTLMCTVDMDVLINSVLFRRDAFSYVGIFNPTIPQCNATKFTSNDISVYYTNCDQDRNFTLIKHGNNTEDHRKNWICAMLSNVGGPCLGANNPCLSKIVTSVLRVPVTTVQLTNGSGQTLSSSVNIVRGQSIDIKCSTAPSGSRPRALFQWYYRQGNQSPVLIVDQSISTTPDPITVPGQPESDLLISYSTWTLMGNASYHNMYVYCQARDETNTGNYTQSDEVQLNIVYPPLVHLSTYQSTYNVTESMQSFVFFCKIIEANPQPQANGYSWFHSMSIIRGQTSSSYILPSVQRSDAGEYRCTARNDYGAGTSDSLDLIVQYPPVIQVVQIGSTMQNQTAMLTCEAWGNPAETIFYPWVHMWEGLPIRMGLQSQNNSTHSVLILDRVSLESMGTYVCTGSNGIMGISEKLNQTGLESLHVKGTAYILVDNARFIGDISLTVDISIPFYSDPAIESFIIQTNGSNVMNTSRTMTYLSKDIVNYKFYNKAIKLNSQKVNFVIQNMTREDFGNYTVLLTNSIGSTSFQFHLDPFAPSTNESIMNPVPTIAGGVSAGFVVILIVTIGVFLWRRNRHPHVTEQAITMENNRNASVRPTDGDLYEKLNSNANSDIQMYSSLNTPTPSEDHQKHYENT
ncbi:hypothetical protein CHS0354_030900 [Potamilus streckersoni]|uniref:Ig-like domain-containing protein n=1 Tax=Potamilus streckersoni TaxID=2493646 RepID=A0AAE0RM91_9BIVA|nr:hypothetical protein CHS0354_030900 [Potamilus streckersoni]